ncbi:MAG TPA: small multi-drug export protein [bacterium]|nr:small multi-drug export protein [bacterium]HOL66106.1 small multi-drug export protein [bacterium]HPP11173.1 small multi-drug export protein [bacterium]
MKQHLIVVILGMLPISELRGAIPYGLGCGLSLEKVVALAILGNFIPVIPLFLFLKQLLDYLKHWSFGRKMADWLVHRTLSQSRVVEVYKTLGLLIFVGIPLPMTGAWTGTMAAVLLGMSFRDCLIGVTGGILMAAVIVSLVSLGLISLF